MSDDDKWGQFTKTARAVGWGVIVALLMNIGTYLYELNKNVALLVRLLNDVKERQVLYMPQGGGK